MKSDNKLIVIGKNTAIDGKVKQLMKQQYLEFLNQKTNIKCHTCD